MSPSNLTTTNETIVPNLSDALLDLLEERDELEEKYATTHRQFLLLEARNTGESRVLRNLNRKIQALREQIDADSSKKTREEELEEVVGMGGAEAVARWEGTD